MTLAANCRTATLTSRLRHYFKSYFPSLETSRGHPGRSEDMSAGTMSGAREIDMGFTKLRETNEEQVKIERYSQKKTKKKNQGLNLCWTTLMLYCKVNLITLRKNNSLVLFNSLSYLSPTIITIPFLLGIQISFACNFILKPAQIYLLYCLYQ